MFHELLSEIIILQQFVGQVQCKYTAEYEPSDYLEMLFDCVGIYLMQ